MSKKISQFQNKSTLSSTDLFLLEDTEGYKNCTKEQLLSGFSNSGGGFTKIEQYAVNDASDLIIPELDGNTDLIYKVLIEGIIQANADRWIKIRPNNDTGNNYNYALHFAQSNNEHVTVYSSCDGLFLARSTFAQNTQIVGEVVIAASSSRKRSSRFSGSINSQYYATWDCSSFWNNTTDNITSLVFNFGGMTTFVGTISLFKI